MGQMGDRLSLREVHLCDEGTAPTLRAAEVAAYVTELAGCGEVRVRGSFLLERSAEEQWPEIARRLAGLKVMDVSSPWRQRDPAHGEVEFERRRLAKEDRGPHGVVYEGFGLQVMLREMMAASRSLGGCATVTSDKVHIMFTNRLVATWGDDLRHHLRTIILGIPAIISTSGLVEAPAKPREFYLAQRQLGGAGQSQYALARLREQFRGRFLDHDDPRLTEVAKGYVMQAVAYQLTGEAFCDDPGCRLFNAHWQEEMLRAQLGEGQEQAPAQRGGRYCGRHQAWLRELKEECPHCTP